ncbi:MAG: protein kinase domain-containing protein [Planctomycetota bacterium]
MKPDQHQRAKRLFLDACDLPPAERAALLDRECGGDSALRSAVEDLLANDADPRHLEKGAAVRSALEEVLRDQCGSSAPNLSRIGPYDIERELGRGGMGLVYLGRDSRLGRAVAIKFLPEEVADDPFRRRRFEAEARIAASLNHPNIATIYELGEAEGTRFIAMEYVEGCTLGEHLEQAQNLSLPQKLQLAAQITEGLVAAHARNIVHRDLKPGNVMVTTDRRIKILDFGLAKALEPYPAATETAIALTEPGTWVGTVDYMSPEQARHQAVDVRSDLFSLGAVMYEMLTGSPPFRRATIADTISAILSEPVVAPSAHGAEVSRQVDLIVGRLLEKELEDRYQTAREVLDDLRRTDGVPARAKPLKSIAVLSFADMSPQRDQEYFCDGLAEELINALAQVERLHVASRTSAFQFKGKAVSIEKIGRELKVETVLEGSVRRADNRLRITAQHVRVADGYRLWSQRYDRDLEDIFALQDEIARTIVDALKIGLVDAPRAPLVRRHTDNVKAYSLYLKGRFHWNRRSATGVARGIEHFEEAIELDPSYALAWAGIAESYAVAAFSGFVPAREARARAKPAANKALELDDTLAEAHAVLANLLGNHDWDWLGAEREYKRAIELNPAYPTVHHWYSMFLGYLGRHEEALAELRRAEELDPLSLIIVAVVSRPLYLLRRFDEALKQVGKALEMDPSFAYGRLMETFILVAMGRAQEAVPGMRQGLAQANDPVFRGTLGYACAAAGMHDEARRIAGELEIAVEQGSATRGHVALVYMGFPDADCTFTWLERCFEQRECFPLLDLRVSPAFDPLRDDPRLEDLANRIGLPK